MFLGIDTGGTFTDFVLFDSRQLIVHKVLSTPESPELAVLRGIADLGLSMGQLQIIHGSTVATNAVLQGQTAKTVFITNNGLKDMLTIGRQARRELYNLTPQPVAPPVPEELCLEANGRLSADGTMLEPFTIESDERLKQAIRRYQPQAVAINLLFSFLDDMPEKHIESLIDDDIFVTCSSSLLPVYREYERGIATWLNAATGPLMQSYLRRLKSSVDPAVLTIMQSSGDTIGAIEAGKKSAHLLLSGPAGGLLGAKAVAAAAGIDRIMTFDMGGTSSDVALIDGEIQVTDEGYIAGYPVAVPMVDMHTIGAGGGSLGWVDGGGLLQVGPKSAGASPGPACYGQGGQQATVTDANVLLGRLPDVVSLAGSVVLDCGASHCVISKLAQQLKQGLEATAEGIIRIANEHMAQALRVISIEKGFDPSGFTLVSFGGAGGLHVCDLAEALGMTQAMVPLHAGVLSAYGMLVAPRGRRFVKTFMQPLAAYDRGVAENIFTGLIAEGKAALISEGVNSVAIEIYRWADIRYIGQSSVLRIVWDEDEVMSVAFHRQHKRRYGHDLDEPLELVNLHVAVQAPSVFPGLPKRHKGQSEVFAWQTVSGFSEKIPIYVHEELAVYNRLAGPALVIGKDSTTWIKPGWQAEVDDIGHLLLKFN